VQDKVIREEGEQDEVDGIKVRWCTLKTAVSDLEYLYRYRQQDVVNIDTPRHGIKKYGTLKVSDYNSLKTILALARDCSYW